MRVLSVGLFAPLLVLFTDATAIEKRAVSAPVQTCLDDIALTNIAYDVYFNRAFAINANSTTSEILLLHLSDYAVEKNLTNNAIPHCCSSGVNAYTDEEFNAVINSVSAMSGKAVDTMQILVNKQPAFNKLLVWNRMFSSDFNFLAGNTTIFGNCLSQRSSASSLSALALQLNKMNAAIKNAYDVFKAAIKS